jgi:hypothetical protein
MITRFFVTNTQLRDYYEYLKTLTNQETLAKAPRLTISNPWHGEINNFVVDKLIRDISSLSFRVLRVVLNIVYSTSKYV